MKFGRQMLNHVENSKYYCKKTKQFTTPKDDMRPLADLKQQISQKMILLRSTVIFWRCAAK